MVDIVEKVPLLQTLKTLKLPAIIAFGNPLLDITVVLNGEGLLKKYNLDVDSEVELSEFKMQELISELPPELEQRIGAGGSAQNTMRVLQWLCGGSNGPQLGVYYGSLGKDSRGTILQNLVRAAGLDARYTIHPTLPTGVCVSLINGSSRSLTANIGAAGVYTVDDLKKNNLPLDTVQIIYIEGFFITHSMNVVKELVELIREKNIAIAFNLNGVYIFKEHHSAICEMVGLAKIIFGNAREMTALAEALNLKFDDVTDIPFLLNDLKKVSVDISSTKSKEWLTDEGVIVMTQGGASPAIVVWGRGQSFQVQPVAPDTPVVDTTGAGDSLVAGFLAGALAGWDPESCLELGCKIAGLMVTRLGVTLPTCFPLDLLQ